MIQIITLAKIGRMVETNGKAKSSEDDSQFTEVY